MAFRAVSAAPQWVREALWSIITGHWGLPWGFPFLLSGSRRWDHRTSLHRWQLRLKVSRSRGAYRLLARCEILPCMLCLFVPDLLLHREMGCHSPPPRVSLQFDFYCFLLCFSDQKRKEKDAPTHPSFIFFFLGVWLPGICLSLPLSFPININPAALIYHSAIIKILVPHAAFIIKDISWRHSL